MLEGQRKATDKYCGPGEPWYGGAGRRGMEVGAEKGQGKTSQTTVVRRQRRQAKATTFPEN